MGGRFLWSSLSKNIINANDVELTSLTGQAGTADITINNDTVYDAGRNVLLNDGHISITTPLNIVPPAPAVNQGFLYKNNENLLWRNQNGIYNLLNSLQDYKQEFNNVNYSSSSVTYANAANPITYINMPLGDYAIWFSCKALMI